MRGVHAGRYEEGDVLQHVQETKERDKQLEREPDERRT